MGRSLVDEYSLQILFKIKATGTARFRSLEVTVRNPKTLSLRLRALAAKGLIASTSEGYVKNMEFDEVYSRPFHRYLKKVNCQLAG